MTNDYFYLCFNCGWISPFETWKLMKHDPDDENHGLIPVEDGDMDPVCICPICKWEHVDDDSNPGIQDGTLLECAIARALALEDWSEHWMATMVERYNGPPS